MQKPLQEGTESGEKPRPWPLTAWICVCFGFAQLVASAIVWFFYGGLGPTMQDPPASEVQLFDHAKIMLLPALILELSYMLSSRNGLTRLQRTSSEISCLLLLEFAAKVTCYSIMSHFAGGIVHMNLRALGPVRGCYTVRFVEWSFAVPTLLIIGNHPLNGRRPIRECIYRLRPNMFATWAYILASWVALVTPNAAAGWSLVAVSFVAYLVSLADQISIIRETDPALEGRRFKIYVIVLKEVVFFAYGIVYLLGVANMISSFSEQVFYTYADVLLKVVQASAIVVVRTWDDVAFLNQVLQDKVETGKQDMSRLFRRASAPIFAVASDGCILAWNDHLAQVSGITESEATGKTVLEFVHEESKDILRQAIDTCWNSSSSSAVEIMINRMSKESNGKDEAPVQIMLTLVLQQGTDPGDMIIAVGQDLTKVAQLKALQERKARFTAVLGHELRSPLHGIIGLSGTMAEASSDKGQKRQLGMIKGCAARLLDLVTNIMEMSKAEKLESAGAQCVFTSNVNVMDLVDEVVAMTEMAIDKSGKKLIAPNVKLVNEMREGTLPVVKGDEYKITQLLYNLVTNAAKFTASGTIRLSAREVDGMLNIDIADTGSGISKEALEKIFEPFQQEQSKCSTSFQGIGLGLSVAMSIAKIHGGGILVQSTVGKGSTFTVRLPCDTNHKVACTQRGPASIVDRAHSQFQDMSGKKTPQISPCGAVRVARKADSKATLPRGGIQAAGGKLPLILSVDDDEINQEVIERSFGSEYRIVRAMNGMEALAYLDSGKEFPSIMLLDVMMPGMTGFEVVTEIRKTRAIMHMQLPVVMLSARSPQEATATDAFNSGATDYLQKPFNASMLKLRLQIIDEIRQELRSAEAAAGRVTGDDAAHGTAPEGTTVGAAMPPASKALEAAAEHGSPNTVLEVAARSETIQKLENEREQLHSRLNATLSEATKAKQQLKCAEDERDRLKKELAERIKESVDTPVPEGLSVPALTEQTTGIRNPSSLTCPMGLDMAERTAEFYRIELQQNESKIAILRHKVDRHKSEAWLQRHRADGLERELHFVRHLGQPLYSSRSIS